MAWGMGQQVGTMRNEMSSAMAGDRTMTSGAPDRSDLETAWASIRTGLRRDIGARLFDQWLRPVGLGGFCAVSGTLDLEASSDFSANYVSSNFASRISLAWRAARVDTPLAAIDEARLQEIAAGDGLALIGALIARDKALEGEANAIEAVERLAHYARDLGALANNFVSFRDFYVTSKGNGHLRAVFQAGTLFLDGRSCNLCVHVLDAAKHAALATLSGVYLAYCDCVRGGEKMTIAAAFTAGDADQLMVGRNGVFYDRDGKDWDATITKLIEHPISIRQAFWTPYKKLVRLVGEQFQKFAAARAKAADDMTASGVLDAQKKAEAAKAAAPGTPTAAAPAGAPAPFDVAKFAGIFAAIGLAVGALGTALAAVVTGFLGLRWWQMPLAVGGLMLMISGPSMALAWFKLRNRNLGPILDANGWAVNARARINIPFGTSLTHLAKLPEGAERSLADPYAEKKKPWGFYLFLLVLAVALLVWAVRSAGQ